MPCIFCIAVFTILAGAVTTAVLDQIEAKLASASGAPVRRTTETASVTKFELDVTVPALPGTIRGRGQHAPTRRVPVAVTVFKGPKRVRIQVLTHEITRVEAEAVEDHLAEVVGLRIVDRSDQESEAKVREAVSGASHSDPAGEAAALPPAQPTYEP